MRIRIPNTAGIIDHRLLDQILSYPKQCLREGPLSSGGGSKLYRYKVMRGSSFISCIYVVSQGKEHMIESEIAILSSVSHPNIIELEEVFDFPTEKYLIMEYVQVAFFLQLSTLYLIFIKMDWSRNLGEFYFL